MKSVIMQSAILLSRDLGNIFFSFPSHPVPYKIMRNSVYAYGLMECLRIPMLALPFLMLQKP